MKATRIMKVLALTLLLTGMLALSSCDLFRPSLKITNASGYDLDFVKWNGVDFGDDSVWDYNLGYYVTGISGYGSSTRDVSKGSDYVYFYFTDSATKYRTTALVTVGTWEDATFTLYGSTLITTARITGSSQTSTETYQIVPVPGEKSSE